MKYLYIFSTVVVIGLIGFVFWSRTKPAQVQETVVPAISPTPVAGVTSKTTMKQYNTTPAMTIDTKKSYTATITTDKGVMIVSLFAKEAPNTVNNFVFLAKDNFYSNTVFHRIINGFMIQGGDPQGTGMGGPGYSFADEKVTRDYTRGTIAMANSGPDTNGSQFFVMHADYNLPKNYVIFGSIDPSDTASLATLDAIATVQVTSSGGESSKPMTPPVIQSIEIIEK